VNIFHHPSVIGVLLVGIAFNAMLGILGLLGFELLDALYLASTFLTIIGAVAVQYLSERSGKDDG
jgi:hypothetical protein